MMDVNKVSALDWRRTAHVAAAQMNKAHKLLDTSLFPPCHKISAFSMFLSSGFYTEECSTFCYSHDEKWQNTPLKATTVLPKVLATFGERNQSYTFGQAVVISFDQSYQLSM